MTSQGQTPMSSYLYIDDVARASVKPQYRILKDSGPISCGPPTCFYSNYKVDFTQSELALGLKRYAVDKPVVCSAINTQAETVSLTQGLNIANNYYYT
jgi:hypothetical protein